jgi:cell shape-determining protein MreC
MFKNFIILMLFGVIILIFLPLWNIYLRPTAPVTFIQNSADATSTKPANFNSEDLIPSRLKLNPYWFNGKIALSDGENLGIQSGQAVIDSKGHLLGLVTDVNATSAEFISIYNPDIKIPVEIGEKKINGLLQGVYNYGSEVVWINSEENLNKQNIFTSSLQADLRQGLFIGEIHNYRQDTGKLFYRAEVRNTSSLIETKGFVWVLKNKV